MQKGVITCTLEWNHEGSGDVSRFPVLKVPVLLPPSHPSHHCWSNISKTHIRSCYSLTRPETFESFPCLSNWNNSHHLVHAFLSSPFIPHLLPPQTSHAVTLQLLTAQKAIKRPIWWKRKFALFWMSALSRGWLFLPTVRRQELL